MTVTATATRRGCGGCYTLVSELRGKESRTAQARARRDPASVSGALALDACARFDNT